LAYFKDGKISSIYFSNKASANYIRSIYLDKDNVMWLGTYGGGLIYFKNGKFKIITKRDGLFDNYIHATVEDRFGYFWMPTNHGLFRVSKKQLIDFVEGKISSINYTLYPQNTKLPSNEFNGGMQPQFCIPDSNTILFPSFTGIVAVDLTSLKENRFSPPVYIESFSVDNRIRKDTSLFTVPEDYSEIKINYTAVSFVNPKEINFKYKLEPLDKTWKNLNSVRSITFAHLPPGEYKFRLRAFNLKGEYEEAFEPLNFYIEAPFYRKTWFKIFMVLLLISLVSLFFMLRLRLAKKREMKLNELIKKRTEKLSVALEEARQAKINEEKHRIKAERLNKEKSELLRIVTHDLKNPIGVIKNASEFIISEIEDPEMVLEMRR